MENMYVEYDFLKIENKYNLIFKNKDILVQAFTHGSFNKYNVSNYQRLEFLGDAVLQMIISDYMFNNNQDDSEGDMSKKRGALVSEYALAYVMKKENLSDYILYGSSLIKSSQKSNSYIADVYESFLAAIYLDKGYKAVKEFVTKTLIDKQDEILKLDELIDYKTQLQELLQVNGTIQLTYNTYKYEDDFKSEIICEDIILGTGTGTSKKNAEQKAAKSAIKNNVL